LKIKTSFKEGYDFEHLRKVLMRETKEGPVPIFELAVDPEIMSEVTGFDFPAKRYDELINIGPDSPPETLQLGVRLMDLIIEFYQAVGYDYVVMTPLVFIPRTRMQLKENPQQEGKLRGWQNEHKGLIMNSEDLEEFPWPSPDTINILPVEYAAERIPDGMKVVVFIFGIFEDLKLLMSFENMAIRSIDEPELLGDILERLTVLQEAAIDMAAAHPATGAILYAEDMGFNTATMLSPTWMQEWVIPRHERLAAASHKHDKPFILHSCGQIDALMEDEIETVGIDARHSFQDNIEPVEEVYEKYGDRISILGGIDVDLLARGTKEEVARRTRQVLEACAPGGGFCMGSGNSVANFCKIENYYAMLDETRRWNQEHGWT
jgi:uroporphyrinogen decarboxylase